MNITTKKLYEEEEESIPRPVSPMSLSTHNSTVTLTILAVFEFETPIDESETLDFLRNDFVPITPRFSWTIETDKKGVPTWKKVEIRYEDHLIVPTFPSGLQTREEYDERLREYISEIGGVRFPEGKPLWEVHLIKYPSLNGVRSLVFKVSHAIGDGYSYAKVLYYAFKRVGNQSLPLSLPQVPLLRQQNGKAAAGKGKKILEFISKGYSASDVGWSLLKAMVMKDPPSAIRSETTTNTGLFKPINISTLTFSLERINQLKSKLGVKMNDLILGAISYMIHLYMVRMGQISNDSSLTILVMINMRQLKGYKTFEEMINAPDSWGNHSKMFPVPIPSFGDSEKVNPLDFIIKAKETMSKKKNSILIDVLDPVLNILRGIKGQKGLNRLLHSTFRNSSTMISSVIGPKEQMAIGEHPVSSFYGLVTGVPQSLAFTSVSFSGQFKLVVTMEKGFIDSKIFTTCMNEAFDQIFEAAGFASKDKLWLGDNTPLKTMISTEAKIDFLKSLSSGYYGMNITPTTCVTNGVGILKEQAVTDLSKWDCFWIMIAWGVLFRILFYVCLLVGRKNKRK